MTSIIIADDHPIVRKGLRQILAEIPDPVVIDEAVDGRELLSKIDKKRYDLVLLDISMPGRNGLEILKLLKGANPGLPVLVLSIYPEDEYAVRAFKGGASGYLQKNSAPEELVTAIQTILVGRKYVTHRIGEKLVEALAEGNRGLPHEPLSDREYEVFGAIASGMALKDIAQELSLSRKTISTYRSRILKKMGMKRNSEIVRYALDHRLLDET